MREAERAATAKQAQREEALRGEAAAREAAHAAEIARQQEERKRAVGELEGKLSVRQELGPTSTPAPTPLSLRLWLGPTSHPARARPSASASGLGRLHALRAHAPPPPPLPRLTLHPPPLLSRAKTPALSDGHARRLFHA
eukprot:881972-Prymnesium_polylepis.1